MNARSQAILTCGVLLVGMGVALTLVPTPFVVASPGPTENVLAVVDGEAAIRIEGADDYSTTGTLDLTTVRQTRAETRLDLGTAYSAWLNPDRDLLPRALVYQDDVSGDEVRQENARLLDRSEEDAKAAALRQLDIEVPERVVVEAVTVGGPSDGTLEPGDILLEVNGEAVVSAEQVRTEVTKVEPGDAVQLTIKRPGASSETEPETVEVVTAAAPDDATRPVIGIVPAPGYDFPVDITIVLDNNIGGPSAGLIFAIGIVDRMTPGALLNEAHIAGTGTIDGDGLVGAIGGIHQKIAAARSAGAVAFLVPAGNCLDIVGSRPGDMELVKVTELEDALTTVEAIANGDVDGVPTC